MMLIHMRNVPTLFFETSLYVKISQDSLALLHVDQDRDKWQTAVNMLINLFCSTKYQEFLG